MPKAGVPQSRKRREAAKAAEEAKRPTADGKARSPLAEFLRDPTAHKERELLRAAANGELTTHDLQAGIAAQLASARKLLPGRGRKRQTPEAQRRADSARETDRQVHVLVKQLMESLKDVVLEKGSGGGPSVVVELHWPDAFAGPDRGDDVRLRAPSTETPDGQA